MTPNAICQETLIQANSLAPSVHLALEFDFSAEAHVDEDNIGDSEGHAEEPPCETDRESLWAGDAFGEGHVAIGSCGGGKESGIKSQQAPASMKKR